MACVKQKGKQHRKSVLNILLSIILIKHEFQGNIRLSSSIASLLVSMPIKLSSVAVQCSNVASKYDFLFYFFLFNSLRKNIEQSNRYSVSRTQGSYTSTHSCPKITHHCKILQS